MSHIDAWDDSAVSRVQRAENGGKSLEYGRMRTTLLTDCHWATMMRHMYVCDVIDRLQQPVYQQLPMPSRI